HYGRQHRCVLRYYIASPESGVRSPEPPSLRLATGDAELVIYGKVAADWRGALAGQVIAALRERVLESTSMLYGISGISGTNGTSISGRTRAGAVPCPYRFNVPRSVGCWPDLQLALFEG